jgi:XTP/dITP diphosphohydrolase
VDASRRPLVLATRNPHKVREVARILAPWGIKVEPLPEHVELPPEDGDTFEANALPKARRAALAVGRPAIADDSGIEAEMLDGAPGVGSARYAGERATDQENLDKLRREASVDSRLRYVCALAFVDPESNDEGSSGPLERVFFGYCLGRMAAQPSGTGGFGYDPTFVPDDGTDGRTMAELSDEEKDAISHRGRALETFAHWFSAHVPLSKQIG